MADLLHHAEHMQQPDEETRTAPDDPESRARLRETIAALAQRSRAVTAPRVRHDVRNAIGAARNALALLDEGAPADAVARFNEILYRNLDRAERLLQSVESGRDERDDLGRTGQRDDGDPLGL
jgi:hypothetical protein